MQSSIVRRPGLAEISPEWTEFSKHVQVPPLIGTPEELRQMQFPQDDSPPVGFSTKQIPVPGHEGWTNQARIYTPDVRCQARAVVLYVHGGGWTIGDLDSEDAVCRTMCKSTGAVVVSLDYRKAPENPFPVGLEDVWAGVLWVCFIPLKLAKKIIVFKNIESLGGDSSRVILGGLSAGGNITAVLAQRARDTKQASFCGQILRVPLVVHPKAQPADLDFSSYDENVNAPILPSTAVTQFLNYYNAPPEDIRVSPLLTPELSGLPRTYIQVAGADPLRDDGFAYAEKLQQAGVPVKVSIYPGLPHGFMMLPLATSHKSDEDLTKAINWMAEA
ncbi:Alpha/Beta hydrolase protein [Dactylonectria estremocensis]|uniref:Alpha/Beta hydrolase protein n=1 Tax=Dactylonectria estremocensis TaxID=1079267 RepID=A0A9P9IGX3_9HYPO|nr:Alpha/Beta hydrolase protein [Dactylonectria estremocensis]